MNQEITFRDIFPGCSFIRPGDTNFEEMSREGKEDFVISYVGDIKLEQLDSLRYILNPGVLITVCMGRDDSELLIKLKEV